MPPAKRKRRTLPSLDRVLALQIKELRDRQGKSQQQLADMLGETQSTITRIESGERSITVSELYRIAAALNCAPIELLSGGLTGEDVPVTPELRLPSVAAHDWIVGIAPLAGTDGRGQHAFYLVNISAERARDAASAMKMSSTLRARYESMLKEDDDAS